MADIGAVWRRSAAAERALLAGWSVGLVLGAGSAQSSIGSVIPFPGSNVGRRIANWTASTVEALRSLVRTPPADSEPERRYYHPRRETFMEDAAMSRAMDRL
jgi:hypothetical protein